MPLSAGAPDIIDTTETSDKSSASMERPSAQGEYTQLPMDILTSTSPAPSTLPNDKITAAAIVPPQRPKSTPFPEQIISHDIQAVEREGNDINQQSRDSAAEPQPKPASGITFSDLPTEVHEFILDHIFGERSSTLPSAITASGWSKKFRHSRRRQLSNLALVNLLYKDLVQGRLFKHIKVKGTRPSITEAICFFAQNAHLQQYPRHVEVWSPVWERRHDPDWQSSTSSDRVSDDLTSFTRTYDGTPGGFESTNNLSEAYQLSSRNSSLYEIFEFVGMVFPEACVLTLEGGHCKKPPKIQHFSDSGLTSLPRLEGIKTLILKSAWNLMRTVDDFNTIMAAVPRLLEWHTSYAKAKSKSYLNISRIMSNLPRQIQHVDLLLESDYIREDESSRVWRKIYPSHCHICVEMAKALPRLERFTYSGRICHQFFSQAISGVERHSRGNTKVKHIDLTVKNCCRDPGIPDGTDWVSDPTFITALETLVVAAINSLAHLKAVSYLRIRFVDLGSPMPLLTPYFQLRGNECTGLYSNKITAALAESRPIADFVSRSEEDFEGLVYGAPPEYKLEAGVFFPRRRPLCLKVAGYETKSYHRHFKYPHDLVIN